MAKYNFYFSRLQDFRMSSRKTAGRRATTKKRAQRATSNVFAMFDQAQIAEFKEAFNMIDQNHDGFIDKEDLHDMLASLGECFKNVKIFQKIRKNSWKYFHGLFIRIDNDCTLSLNRNESKTFLSLLLSLLQKLFFTGKNPTDEYLEAMMNEAPGPINFTMFLTLFGERLQGTDPEDVIKNAFGCFDEENTGHINEERLRELLTTMGDR